MTKVVQTYMSCLVGFMAEIKIGLINLQGGKESGSHDKLLSDSIPVQYEIC
jgi:hypothetical protein